MSPAAAGDAGRQVGAQSVAPHWRALSTDPGRRPDGHRHRWVLAPVPQERWLHHGPCGEGRGGPQSHSLRPPAPVSLFCTVARPARASRRLPPGAADLGAQWRGASAVLLLQSPPSLLVAWAGPPSLVEFSEALGLGVHGHLGVGALGWRGFWAARVAVILLPRPLLFQVGSRAGGSPSEMNSGPTSRTRAAACSAWPTRGPTPTSLSCELMGAGSLSASP